MVKEKRNPRRYVWTYLKAWRGRNSSARLSSYHCQCVFGSSHWAVPLKARWSVLWRKCLRTYPGPEGENSALWYLYGCALSHGCRRVQDRTASATSRQYICIPTTCKIHLYHIFVHAIIWHPIPSDALAFWMWLFLDFLPHIPDHMVHIETQIKTFKSLKKF